MHYEVKQYVGRVRGKYPSHFNACKVLDVGSRDVNGSLKDMFFSDCDYTGIDIMEGKNVDFNTSAVDWNSLGPTEYNTIVCTEVLEHDKDWCQTIDAMISMLREGGLLIITAAGPKRAEHGTKRTTPELSPATTDYYQNIEIEHLEQAFKPMCFCKYEYGREEQDIYANGFKRMTLQHYRKE